MSPLLLTARAVLELLYYASAVVLAVAAVVGLKQLGLMKADAIARSDRAAKEKALQASAEYLGRVADLINTAFDEEVKAKLPRYDGAIGDFTPQSVPPDRWPVALKRFASDSWLLALNQLEVVAAAFGLGIADEELGFAIIGRSFVFEVRSAYDVIALGRVTPANKHRDMIVRLYSAWAPRLTKAELEDLRAALDSRIKNVATPVLPRLRPDV
jgi:hypothetical protein